MRDSSRYVAQWPWQAGACLLFSSELFRALDIGAELAHYRRRIPSEIDAGTIPSPIKANRQALLR
ncbi:hypothetical protein H3V53_26510 [Paraburkholderia bengalensis]|uniref:Uncharacterized protein n=1 Tax=Paraburkholderia bengalensis TaxID=2747562 RepID=A0ABU8IYW5_9BURK